MKTEWYIHQPSYERGSCYLCFGIPRETSVLDECDYIPRLSLYEAQKFLREEKNIIVEVFVDDDSDTPITYNIYKDGECVCHHHGKYWSVKEWSEALLEGIKEAIKILKENNGKKG
jgi:hypothetical protein